MPKRRRIRRFTKARCAQISRSLRTYWEGVRQKQQKERAEAIRRSADSLWKSAAHRAPYLLSGYGITLEQFEDLAAFQNGSCAICLALLAPETACCRVDCHPDTGLVRGLLCPSCAGFLGKTTKTPSFFARAASYLQSPPANSTWAPGSFDRETGQQLSHKQVFRFDPAKSYYPKPPNIPLPTQNQ